MTLDEAVEALNRFEHRGFPRWRQDTNTEGGKFVFGPYVCMSDFEAIAIAEKYVREAAAKSASAVA